MKKLLIIFLLASTRLMAQTDSSAVKITTSIQARDLEYIAGVLPYSEDYETAYDVVKAKFRVAVPPTNNTSVALDSIQVGTWLDIDRTLQKDPYAVAAGVFSRVDAVLRAKNNIWLNNKLNWYITDGTNYYNNIRTIGRKRLTKK